MPPPTRAIRERGMAGNWCRAGLRWLRSWKFTRRAGRFSTLSGRLQLAKPLPPPSCHDSARVVPGSGPNQRRTARLRRAEHAGPHRGRSSCSLKTLGPSGSAGQGPRSRPPWLRRARFTPAASGSAGRVASEDLHPPAGRSILHGGEPMPPGLILLISRHTRARPVPDRSSTRSPRSSAAAGARPRPPPGPAGAHPGRSPVLR